MTKSRKKQQERAREAAQAAHAEEPVRASEQRPAASKATKAATAAVRVPREAADLPTGATAAREKVDPPTEATAPRDAADLPTEATSPRDEALFARLVTIATQHGEAIAQDGCQVWVYNGDTVSIKYVEALGDAPERLMVAAFRQGVVFQVRGTRQLALRRGPWLDWLP
ncbi:MAG: hypothetical protein VKP62_04350 [Candidatus Sericytochromatia bacterium]|nr:hypothetical protein [Candidatus Sericytochromatia bacterium]